MCTVSWIHHPDGYELFCNRDELRTRKAALPPQRLWLRGVQVLAPRDGDFGGAWISVNEFGLSLSLLNLYEASHARRAGQFISRGLLLLGLADADSPERVIARVGETQLSRYQPFTLLALWATAPALVIRWNGRQCSIERNGDSQLPLTSSSFDSGRVVESRKRGFQALANAAEVLDADFLLNFHRGHTPTMGAYSTCMHRADAETVSFSRIKVDSHSIEFQYHPDSPCRAGTAEIQTLLKTHR